MLHDYSWANVLAEIHRRLDAASADDWSDVQAELARSFRWEYQG
jgi:hypothetical protein